MPKKHIPPKSYATNLYLKITIVNNFAIIMAKNKVTASIIGCVGVPAKYGGFETLAEQLCIHLHNKIKLNIFSSSKEYSELERSQKWEFGNRIFIPVKAHGLSSILFDLISLLKAVKHSDIVLILGGSAGIFLPFIKFMNKKTTFIFHPDGVEWKRNKWNVFSKFFLFISIKVASRFSDKIIIDNEALGKYFTRYRDKSEIIEYGGDQYLEYPKCSSEKNVYWLTIARAVPENNLDTIAETFRFNKKYNWKLITNWKSGDYGKHLYEKYKNVPNISIINAVYDKQKITEYFTNCIGYIHGHSTGGTNPSLVSAMWFNKPIICHENLFNRSTTQNLCVYFKNEEQLALLLEQSEINTSEQVSILAKEKYTWKTISQKYYMLFCSDYLC
jgi:hypothetical protein